MLKYPLFFGTSNPYLAMKYITKPIGTVAHEWIMGMSVLEGLRNSNYYAHDNWSRVYKADLGTALPDTYGLQAFLNNFNMRLAKLYDGIRCDSGQPTAFVDRICRHSRCLGACPNIKSGQVGLRPTPRSL